MSELNNRFDPVYYNSDLGLFNYGLYESVKISSVVANFKSGVGFGKQDQGTKEDGIIQIRPTNIKENGIMSFKKNIYIPIDSASESDLIKKNDVLFNNTNSQELVGKSAVFKEDAKMAFSNHITRIRVINDRIIPEYLCLILNVYQKHRIFYAICTNWNNQSGIGLDLLSSLRIPLPPIVKQTEIVKYITTLEIKYQKLDLEAKMILENAKLKIEKIIFQEI